MNLTYEQYRYVFITAAVICGIFLIISIGLFFLLDIKSAIGHITGSTARKQIQKIKNNAHANSQKLTNPGQAQVLRKERITDKISTQKLTNSTEELETGSNETTILGQSGTNETTVLSQAEINETTVLEQQRLNIPPYLNNNYSQNIFRIEFDITFIHTNEIVSL